MTSPAHSRPSEAPQSTGSRSSPEHVQHARGLCSVARDGTEHRPATTVRRAAHAILPTTQPHPRAWSVLGMVHVLRYSSSGANAGRCSSGLPGAPHELFLRKLRKFLVPDALSLSSATLRRPADQDRPAARTPGQQAWLPGDALMLWMNRHANKKRS
jgi:hypothetical protein